jgi:hypothetical protein
MLFVFLFAAITMYAQKFELGASAGFQRNTRLHNKTIYDPARITPPTGTGLEPVLSLKGMYNVNKWQLGLSVDFRKLNFTFPNMYTIPLNPNYWGRNESHGRLTCMPVSIFANRKISLKKFDLYGGASLGYAFSWVDKKLPQFESFSVDRTVGYSRGYQGFLGGVQVGGNYKLNKRMAINAEVGCQCFHFKQEKFDPSYTFSVPATLGFRYRLKPDTNKLH